MATVSFLFIYVSPVSSSFFTEISKCAQRVSCPPRLKCEYSQPGFTRRTRRDDPKGPWVLSNLFCLDNFVPTTLRKVSKICAIQAVFFQAMFEFMVSF